MVMIQVLIAEVTLSDQDEFGVELGLQDGLLFDRSAAFSTTSSGTTLNPGYAFNNQPLGNSATGPNGTSTLNNAALVGSQGLSSFGLNRTNPLGFGGFVFSASSESLSVLIRALKVNSRIEVLSRPQVMTLDNQPAYVIVGQSVPQISGSSSTSVGQNNTVTYKDVGLILNVTPRISPDGLVAMQIDAIKSDVGAEADGIPVSSLNGQIIRAPKINQTEALTVVSAMDGQTVVLGGLITKRKTDFHRKVPWVGDLPVVGRLFRYDGVSNERTELLIIMTPHIVRNEGQADEIKKIEAARMNWCLSDVISLCDDKSLRRRSDDWSNQDTEVIYPDSNPRAEKPSAIEDQPSSMEPILAPPGDANPNKKPGLPIPPEPSKMPDPDSGAMAPRQRFLPANAYLSTGEQNQPQPAAGRSTGHLSATGRTCTSSGRTVSEYILSKWFSSAVTPTVYDAPPKYPTTQQQYYR